MKHECKTMKGVLRDIQEFNTAVREPVDDTAHLSMRIWDDPAKKPNGLIFDWLFYRNRRDGKTFYRGSGMRWLFCPFCGKKIDKK